MSQPSSRNGVLYLTLVVALASLGVAVFALLRTLDSEPEFTDAQRSAAKTACARCMKCHATCRAR